MSRIGKKPVSLPKGVKVSVADRKISAEGPKGTLTFEHRPEILVTVEDGEVGVGLNEQDLTAKQIGSKQVKALWGTTRALIQNMVTGVEKGYEKKLEVQGVGWTAQVAGTMIKLNVGFAAPAEVEIPMGVSVAVDKQLITITGADKQAVGQLAAKIRSKRPPEPYNGKGIKYSDEVIVRKEGKKFGS
ncbi:MAG: 50S ribosomal protein L6 [Planctomycetota bacterium]